MKIPTAIILHSSFFILHSAFAAVPIRWTVETSRLQPAQFDAYHGEEIAFEATLQSYGKPLAIPSDADLRMFWQTNGMGNVYWSTNATLVSSNVISAVFRPAYDPGAASVAGFLGIPASNYRAAFTIRFRGSPGATPFDPPPVPAAEYYTKPEVDSATNAVFIAACVAAADYTDTATNGLLRSESDPSVSAWAKAETKPTYDADEVGALAATGGVVTGSIVLRRSGEGALVQDVTISTNGVTGCYFTTVGAGTGYWRKFSFNWWELLTSYSESDPTVPSWAKAATPPEGMTANAAVLTNGYLKTKSGTSITAANVSGAQTASDVSSAIANSGHITRTAADAAYYPKSQGDAWSTYWDGDDVRVTVTNYDSAVNLPSLLLEQRTNAVSQATNHFKTVWREESRWEKFLGTNWAWRTSWNGFSDWSATIEDEIDEKADRAWGYYNSHTGTYSPDGYTQISSSNMMIAAGMSYQKTVTTQAEVWILTANEPYEPTGVSTNGGFQIKDADGNVQFEIVKGDKVTVAAQANAVTVDSSTTPNTLVVTYNIVATQHPTAEICLDLSNPVWMAEGSSGCPATVVWSGSSGAYVARITPTQTTTKCYAKASYQRGGDTYINNRCAVGLSQIVLNGTTYNLGTATISGNTVLTLTPAN